MCLSRTLLHLITSGRADASGKSDPYPAAPVARLQRAVRAPCVQAEHNLKAELKEKMDAEEERIQALSNLPKESEKKMLHWFRAAKSKIRLFIGNRRTNTHQAYGDVKIKDDKGFDKRHVDWSRVPQQVLMWRAARVCHRRR